MLFSALERFWAEVEQVCQLTLERSKTEVFSWEELEQELPMDLTRAGTMVYGVFQAGFICYGIPVGTRVYVQHHLHLKVQDVAREVGEVLEVLKGEGQAIWTVARSSTLMKLDYHIYLCYPTYMVDAAREMDQLLWGMVERAAGISIPKGEKGRGVGVLPPVACHDTRVGPTRTGCSEPQSDWEALALGVWLTSLSLQSGCRTGEELQQLWTTLQEEAQQMTSYLGSVLEGPLSISVEGTGEGSSDGSTRRRITT